MHIKIEEYVPVHEQLLFVSIHFQVAKEENLNQRITGVKRAEEARTRGRREARRENKTIFGCCLYSSSIFSV